MKAKGSKKKAMGIVSWLLVAAIFFAMQGFPVFAETISENQVWEGEEQENCINDIVSENNICAGTGIPANPQHYCTKKNDGTDDTDFSYVYFGSYPQSEVTDSAVIAAIDSAAGKSGIAAGTGMDVWVNDTKYRRISKNDTNYDGYFGSGDYRYFKWERIKWKVLQNDGNTLFVVADKALDCKNYNEEQVSITWKDSSIRSWLNDTFYQTAFSDNEQSAIVAQNIVNEANPDYGTEGGENTEDTVYLLSISEILNSTYGFCSSYSTDSASRWASPSNYAHARGSYIHNNSYTGGNDNCWWWLRSPGLSEDDAAYVNSTGFVYKNGFDVAQDSTGVCPALHINLSSGCWFTTDDGTSGEGGNGSGSSERAQMPKPGIPGGTYTVLQKVTLATSTEGAEIYYTIDGSLPGKENGIHYTGTIEISNSLTLKAVAVKEGMKDSIAMEEVYFFPPAKPETGMAPSISLGEEQNGLVNSEEVIRFFPGSYQLKTGIVPVSFSKSTEADGSYKLKLAIGIGGADWLDNTKKWNTFKKSVEELDKSSRRNKQMKSVLNKFGGKNISCFEAEGFKAKPEISALGYYELEVDKNGIIVKNSGMYQMDAKWKASTDWQFITPIGPLYLNLEGSGKITGKTGLSFAIQNNSISEGKWNMEGNVVFTPGFSLEGGYGVAKVATIGACGSAEMPIQLFPASKGDFEAKASVHLYVVFVLDQTWDLAAYTKNLWDTTQNKTAIKSGLSKETAAHMGLNPKDLKPVDRSYAEHTTSWQGNTANTTADMAWEKSLSAKAGSEETVIETGHILQSGIMPNTLPQIKQTGGDTIMVFQANADGRNTLDSSVLMYSVYSSGVWSEPVPVWDNGTCDMYADLQTVGDELYLVWQKENARILADGEDGGQALSEIAEKSEICFAKYNKATRKFEEQAYITSDNKVDMMPKLAVNGDKVTAVWITNSENSLLQKEGTNQIVYAELENGVSSKEAVLCESRRGIEEFIPYYEGGILYAAYISNTSEENNTNQVFLSAAGGAGRPVADGNTIVSDVQWLDGVLYYYEEGTMKAYDMGTDTLSVITAGESRIGAKSRIYANNGKTAVLWSAPDQTTGTFSIYSSVKTGEGFSEPVVLYTTASSIKYLDGILKADGSWQFMMNQADTSLEEPNHSLVFATKEEALEVEVESITVDDAARPGEMTPISYIVTNTGEEAITSLVLTITDENGLNKQQNIPVSIAPGESIYDTVLVDLSEVTDTISAKVAICANGQTNTEGNTVEVMIGQTDLVLEAVMVETEENICIVASVSNNSMIPANATLTLYGDVQQKERLETISLDEITKETSKAHTFYINKDSLTMNENGAVYLPVVVTSDKTDWNEDNNTVIKIAYGAPDDAEKKEDNITEDDKKQDGNETGVNEENKNTEPVRVTRLSISAPSKKLAAGRKVKLTLKVMPENASNKAVTWNTSNKKYAVVDQKGTVTLKKAGAGKTVTITAVAKDSGAKKAAIKIKIMKHAVKSIRLKAPSKTLKAGKSMTIKATVNTTGKSANKTLKWQSSNTKYATVNKSGKVKAKKAGRGKPVTITAMSTDGSNKKAKMKIRIK